MATAPLGPLLGYIHTLTAGRAVQRRTDRQLVDDFANRRDEAAFAALVARHGPMVLRVCRRVLGHEQDAEDAFQATFVVLARNIGSIRRRDTVASWLHGVAYRTAMKAKRGAARRRKHEGELRANPPQCASPTWDDVQAVLEEEVQRLPGCFREAFVLCVLLGKSGRETARELGCEEGTVKSRVNRARQQLRQQLARRGIHLTTLLAALSIAESAGGASVPATLAQAAIRSGLLVAACGSAAGEIPSHVAALAAGVTRAMFVTKAKIATAVVLAASLVVGAAVLSQQGTAAREAAQPSSAAGAKSFAAQPKAPAGDAEGDRVEVSGRVLDPDGKPVARATVTFHQRRPQGELPDFFPPSVTGTTKADGRFRFSGTVHQNAPARDRQPMLTLTAHVPGYGPAATVESASPAELKDRTLRLVKDDVPIRGRILSLEGKPIPGVTVRPVAVVANAANDLSQLVKAIATSTWSSLPKDHRTYIVFSAAAAGLKETAVTDAAGKFTLSGFGRERIVILRVDGPTIQTRLLNVMTRTGPTVRGSRPVRGPDFEVRKSSYDYAHGATFDFVPGPATVVEGVVRDQDTAKPVAGVVVRHRIAYDFGWAEDELTTTTDAGGNYRLGGLSGAPGRADQAIVFVPPAGEPYLTVNLSPPRSGPGKPARLDVGLKRGVVVKGRVTDRATGQPVQAIVEYFAFVDNPHLREVKRSWSSRVVSSKKDGSFTLAALPGRGIVAARTDDMRRGKYLYGQGGDAIRGFDARLGGFVTQPHICFSGSFDALVGIEPEAKADSATCELQLDPGKTVKGILVDADGKPLSGVSIRGPFDAAIHIRELPSAAFTIPAVNPHKPQAYFFEHHKKKLAAAVILKGDEPAEFTVKLKPTATVTGRLVTADGEPFRNTEVAGRLEAGQLNMARPWNGFFWSRTDADGRFKIEGLLAGVKLGAQARVNNLFANLALKPGEVKNLGDIKVDDIPK